LSAAETGRRGGDGQFGGAQGGGVREQIQATGAQLLYLPPYSPDFNPIEQCRAQIKQRLRAAKVGSVLTLERHLAEALASVTPQNLQACFTHSERNSRFFTP
jgi:transposase